MKKAQKKEIFAKRAQSHPYYKYSPPDIPHKEFV
jgi:hypothetical protein